MFLFWELIYRYNIFFLCYLVTPKLRWVNCWIEWIHKNERDSFKMGLHGWNEMSCLWQKLNETYVQHIGSYSIRLYKCRYVSIYLLIPLWVIRVVCTVVHMFYSIVVIDDSFHFTRVNSSLNYPFHFYGFIQSKQFTHRKYDSFYHHSKLFLYKLVFDFINAINRNWYHVLSIFYYQKVFQEFN